jgi:HPt (histidine-containing phosphotransfer) domain-containing protein
MRQVDQPDLLAIRPTLAFDSGPLRTRLGGDQSAADAVLLAFAQHAPRQMAHLREAIAKGDRTQARLVAHTIKGSLLWIGAETAATAAFAIEQSASGESPIAMEEALSRLSGEMESVLAGVLSHPGVLPDESATAGPENRN